MKLEFSRQIFEKSYFKYIRPVVTELFHADGRADRVKHRRTDRHYGANSLVSQFANAPKNWREENS